MSTQKQIDANRLNAQKSTGPTSEEGKRKSRLNAKRDGLTGQVITLSEHDLPIFEKFKATFIADLQPATVMETSLANSLAWDTWRLNHLRAIEMNMYAVNSEAHNLVLDTDNPQINDALIDAVTFEKESDKLARLSLYEQRLNRSIHKNLALLRDLQAERKRNRQADLDDEILMAQANDSRGLPYHAPARPGKNGSIFSTSEVVAAVNRKTLLIDARIAHGKAPTCIQFPGAWDNHDPQRPDSGLFARAAA